MPKTLLQQRRGKGKPRYRRATHKSVGRIRFPKKAGEGVIVDLVHDPVKSAPLMMVRTVEGVHVLAAPMNVAVGDKVVIHEVGSLKEGTEVCNVELEPGKGPAMCRSSGTFARVVSHEKKGTVLLLPSKKLKTINKKCRVVVGRVAGGGRKEKPLLKAGKKFHAVKNKGVIWPRVAASAKNAVDHPFGGGSRKTGGPKTTSRRAPPGRKVGTIGARRTGKRKK